VSDDHTIKLWDVRMGRELKTFHGHTEPVIACAFSPDGCYLVSGSGDKTLKLWDVGSGEALASFEGHGGPVIACAFSLDGQHLISASRDNSLKIWDTCNKQELMTLKERRHPMAAWAFAPDGRCVAWFCSLGEMNLWDAATRKEPETLGCHKDGEVTACSFSPDGRLLVSAASDKTIKIWDAVSGGLSMTLLGHSASVRCCAFSPDARCIVSTSDDGTIRIWDITLGEEIARFPLDTTCWTATWSPDGSRLACDTLAGGLHLLLVENLGLGAIVTPWRMSPGDDNSNPSSTAGIRCPFCRRWCEMAPEALGTKSLCPNCTKPIQINKFTINADWQPIAAACREEEEE